MKGIDCMGLIYFIPNCQNVVLTLTC